jgi:hypothetical protein
MIAYLLGPHQERIQAIWMAVSTTVPQSMQFPARSASAVVFPYQRLPAEDPCLQAWGCKPGGPHGPRADHPVPVSCLSGRIETYGTARRTQDVQVPTDANA